MGEAVRVRYDPSRIIASQKLAGRLKLTVASGRIGKPNLHVAQVDTY